MDASRIVSMPRWLPCSEAAAVMGISPRTLRKWGSIGKVQRRGTGRGTQYLVSGTPEEPTRHDAASEDPIRIDNRVSGTTTPKRAHNGSRGNLALALDVDVDTDAAPELAARVAELEEQLSELFDVAATAVEHAEEWKRRAERADSYATGLRDALSLLRVA